MIDYKRKVEAILAGYGWKQRQLADQIDGDQPDISKWKRGTAIPNAENRATLDRLYAALPQPNNAEVADILPFARRKVTVYGQAVAGINGEFVLNGHELFEVDAPPNLNSHDAYAVIIAGDSMAPRFFDGEIAFVDPSIRPSPGKDVVAQISGEEGGAPLAYVKRLERYNTKELVLFQYNPPEDPDEPGKRLPEILRFPSERVVSVHVIANRGLGT